MKKFAAYLILALVLATSLCACGNDSMIDDGVSLPDNNITVPTASPAITQGLDDNPLATPNMDDGIVNDRDGLIEEEDNALSNGSANLPAATKEPNA